jgi:TrmH family RNA methyltransferase
MPTITSRQNPIVARYRAAARGDAVSPLLLDGVHLVADALAAGIQIEAVAVTPEGRRDPALHDLLSTLGRAAVEVTDVSAPVMDAISPVRSSSRVVALAARPAQRDAAILAGGDALAIVAVDIQDPGNVGAILRVAEAAGATGVIVAGASADPFGWKALRGSMGSALRLPVAQYPDAERAIHAARTAGCRVVAAIPRGGQSIFEADLRGSIAILVGGEGPGLSAALVETADVRVTIPMQAPVESLNAAVAAALLVYEARRQRTNSKNGFPLP